MGNKTAYSGKTKRQISDKIRVFSQTLRQSYTNFQEHTTEETKKSWHKAKADYDAWLEKGEGFRRSQQEARLFRYGNKAGKLLANLAKGSHQLSHIKSLKDKQGVPHHTPSKINEILSDFYRNLYTADGPMGGTPEKWLDNPVLPTLSDEEREVLGGVVSQDELERAIKNLKSHKAPGPDGYTAEFFKILNKDIAPTLTQLFNSFLQGTPIPTYMNMAYIKVLPKHCKDLSLPASYRPISLINVDLKLLSKIMADRLAAILPRLIAPTQTGFVRGRSAVSNIRKVVAVLDELALRPEAHSSPALLTIDVEKAFDNVGWEWLNKVLDRLGVSGPFRAFLSSLYAKPLARIYTPGHLSDIFPLQKGTRQGCPLSPLLFNLAMEPLSRFL